MSVSSQHLNAAFSSKLDTSDGRDKTAAMAGAYIRDHLREVSFARKIIPPQEINRTECQRSESHDTLVKIIDIEPQSKAMSLTFGGQPHARYITGKRATMGFFTISSELFQKTEQELLAYEMPITKIIEENSVKDIQEIEDRNFLIHCEAAVQALQREVNGGGVGAALDSSTVGTTVEFSIRKGELARLAGTQDATVRPMQRLDLVSGYKMIDGHRQRCEMTLITEVDFDDILGWTLEDNGDKLQSETGVEGYTHNLLLGRKYIRTIKTDILRPGNLYFFTAPDFLGRFYILNQPKFYIDKTANLISFQAWEDIGMLIANVGSIRKIELYSADANPMTNAQSLLDNFIPKAEDALGEDVNGVERGLKFPSVSPF